MSWLNPRTWVAGELVTATLLNAQLRDQLNALNPAPALALPSSPVTGDWAILTDSLTVPTYTWRFRYNGSLSGAYKWQFAGGAPLIKRQDAQSSVTSTSYADLADGTAPTFALPVAGDWQFGFGAELGPSGSTSDFLRVSVYAGTTPLDGDSAVIGDQVGGTNVAVYGHTSRQVEKLALSAAATIKLQYKSASGPTQASQRWLSILPVRVG